MRQYFSCFLIVCSGLSNASADSNAGFGDKEFTLSLGESVHVEGGLGDIKFIKILKDSRCPVDVTCVWAGNVKAEFETLNSTGGKTRFFLNTGFKSNKLSIRKYTLQLISIFPPKVEGVSIAPEQYQLKLRIKAR